MSYLLCTVNRQWWSRILGGSIGLAAILLSIFIFTSPVNAAPSACLVGNGDSVGYTYHPTNCFEGSGVDLTPNKVGSTTYYDGTGSTYQYRAIKGDGFIRRAAKGSGTGVWSTGSGVTKLTQGTDYTYYSKADYDKEMQENAGEQAYADTGFNALDPVLAGDFKSKLKDVSCHAGDCAAAYDTAWKAALNECFTSSANLEEDQTRGSDEQTEANHKSKFASCLAGKLTGNTEQNKQAIINKLNGGGISLTTLYDSASDAQNNVSDPGGGTTGNEESSCGVDGIGWFVCPAMSFLGDVMDNLFDVIAQFLEVEDDQVSHTATRSAWAAMRNFANIAFVIAFLFIIYSQLTGAGITNYGVKKLLPRVIIAAILVNLSFFICQLAVDISNLLGYSLKQVFDSIQVSTGVAPINDASANGWGIAVMVVGLLAAGITAAFAISIPVLLAALLALLLIVGILLARKAFIIVLIVISPLAFVAFLLPNTEQWFKKWQKTFMALLLVFPTVSVVFGASQLIGSIVKGSSPNEPMIQLTAIGIAAIPLFVVPSLLKGSMNAAGAIGAKLSGMADRRQAAIGGKAKARLSNSRLGEAQRGLKNKYAVRRAARRGTMSTAFGKTALGKKMGLQNGIDNSKLGRAFGLDKGAAAATQVVAKQEDEEVASLLTQFRSKHGATGIDAAEERLKSAISNGEVAEARAMQQYLLNAGGAGINKLNSVYSDGDVAKNMAENGGKMHRELGGDALAAGVKSKSAAMDKYFTGGPTDTGITSHMNKGTYESLNAEQLSQQKNIGDLASQNLIDSSMASSVLNNPNAAANLSSTDRQTLEKIAGTQPAPQPSSSNTSPTQTAAPTAGSSSRPNEQTSRTSEPSLRGGETTTESGFIVPRDMNK